ncbi:unnamed protein product [marine sediment metagenome]|uniref:Uncharacterized protein n=1 Tax=marine sediment metagenome TaxID=412755 RepID=X1QZ69_9ZZZZ
MNPLSFLLPALLPPVVDGIRSVVARFTGIGAAEPKTAEQLIAVMQAETERLRVIAELDRPAGEISKWVCNLRSSFRYIMAGVIILSTFTLAGLDAARIIVVQSLILEGFLNLMASVFAFLFGDRVYLHLKGGR